ncbi:hypothetical protein PPACK8108_LOCUS16904 [Phakopsora pachyrhizi]|uniref:Uncharacterized protein n=1 Tax=Phakopsora pachyrhizi TaxID=170000 RepID=A0AAV0B8I2_PHAPC|nr:hypothetical protein PPACK8108_LOCUS16904 [Phakopsora pachyrhizi]
MVTALILRVTGWWDDIGSEGLMREERDGCGILSEWVDVIDQGIRLITNDGMWVRINTLLAQGKVSSAASLDLSERASTVGISIQLARSITQGTRVPKLLAGLS